MGRRRTIAMTRLTLFICAGLLLGPTRAKVGAWPDTNLLQNPSFEAQDRYVDFLPAGWLPDSWAAGADFVWDNAQFHEGSRSIRVSQTELNDARWLQAVAVQPNTDYRLSGWIKTVDVTHSPDPIDAGANLCIYGTYTRTQGVFGTTDWTYVQVTFNSGNYSRVQIGARLGYWSGTTTGIAWFDELRLEPVTPPPPPASTVFLPIVAKPSCITDNPSWKILVLLYTSTDFEFVDGNGDPHHFVASVTQAEKNRIAYAATRFAVGDIPTLNSCNMKPTVAIRNPDHPLTNLTPLGCNDYSPSPWDAAPDRDPAFDSVIAIWDGSGTDLLTGEDMIIQGCAWAWGMGTGQTYVAIPVDFVGYTQRNIFKHEWGHSILFYYDAAGTAPKPPVDNHINDTDNRYVHCPTGESYILQDETDLDPIPNSIYNNLSGFTRDYYSGRTATPDQPTRCLGITPSAWATGGPVTKPLGEESARTWHSPADDAITTAVPDRVSLPFTSGATRTRPSRK